MSRSSQLFRNASIALIFVFLSHACAPVNATPSLPTAQKIESPSANADIPTPTATLEIVFPTKTEIPVAVAVAPVPTVMLNVVKGNLFIRRGPNMAFNTIGVLYKNTSAKVIARDVLSDWVQIEIPNSDKTGWVSIQTDYSKIEGNLQDLTELSPTEWPESTYLLNCTHHNMYVLPDEVVIPSSYEYPDNDIRIYPGIYYTVYDIDVPDNPQVAELTAHEGEEVEIREDGLGERRKCP
jgi:hypothetical protein